MHTHALLLPRTITVDELREVLESDGGEWQDHPQFPQGVISCGNSVLFVRGMDQQQNLFEVTAEEFRLGQLACGRPIVATLTLDHSRGPEGLALARRVISKMIERWGGLAIDCGG